MTTTARSLWIWLLLAVLAACGAPVVPALGAAPQEPAAREPLVLVVTLQGKVGTQELARCTRALREAERRGLKYVVFHCDQETGSQG